MHTFLVRGLIIAVLAVTPAVGDLFSVATISTGRSVDLPLTPPTFDRSSHAPPAATDATTHAHARGARERARELVGRYEAALVNGDWGAAFELLARTSLTSEMGLEAFASERAAFFANVDDRYVLGAATRVTEWTRYAPLVSGAHRARAWLIEVTYPALSGNNAGFELFVVAPDASGAWRIWPVR